MILNSPFRSRFLLRCKPLALQADASSLGILSLLVTTLWLSTYCMATPAESRVSVPFANSWFCIPPYNSIEIELNRERQLSFNFGSYAVNTTSTKRQLQAAVIQRLASRHHLRVNSRQLAQLAGLSHISVGIEQLVDTTSLYANQPAGLSAAELQEWITVVRETGADLFQCPIYVDIRADARCGLSDVQRLIHSLQDIGIPRMNFITQVP